MAAVLKLTFLFVLIAIVASASTKSEEKEVQVADEQDDFPSDESVRVEGDDESEEDRLHKKKKKPHHSLAGFLANLIKTKPLKKPDHDPKKVDIVKKTKVIEVTRRLVVNPVCMTVNGKKPDCSPNAGLKSNDDEGLFYIESTVAPKIGDFILNDEDEEDQIAMSRSARYLSFDSTPEIAEVKSSIDDGIIEELSEDDEEVSVDEMGRFIFHKHPKKATSIHTVYVTRVQKVVDHKVTATLSVSNCVPANADIPLCPKKPEIQKPIALWKEEDTKEMGVTEKDIEEVTETAA